MATTSLRMKIYGSRGSYSPTSGKATAVGVNTTCIRFDVGDHVIILDAGSGIINCGKDLFGHFQSKGSKTWKMHLLFTHMHIDHLVGFPYFAMLYMPQSEIHFLAPKILDYDLESVLERFVHPPLFPVGMDDLPFARHFYTVSEHKVIYFYQDGFKMQTKTDPVEEGWIGRIISMRNYMHPKGGSYFYRIESAAGGSFVVATDTEGYYGGDQRLIQFAKGADVLLHDAQYAPDEYGKFQGFGHSTYEMACNVAQKAGVNTLLLAHHDPRYGDETLLELERGAREIFSGAELAAEGKEFVF